MKKYLLILSIIFSLPLSAQKTDVCTCQLLKRYNDSINSTYSKNEFRLLTKARARKPPFSFISISYLREPRKSDEIIDSVEVKIKNVLKNVVPDSVYGTYKIRDSITKIEYSKKYGDIPKPVIIKTGTKDGVMAILFHTNSFYFGKYYLRISNDNGMTWKNYYTGLDQNKNYVFKSNSRLPLFKNKNQIQIEADIVRMIKEPTFPSNPQPTYEIVNNNALVTLNLKEILEDSDRDGLNDLEEKLIYFTNPLSNDTDEDGIMDSEDENPRYSNYDNEFTLLAESILFGNYDLIEDSDVTTENFLVDIQTVRKDISKQNEEIFSEYSYKKDILEDLNIKIIATDDENIRHTRTYGKKIIFVASKEYQVYSKYHYVLTSQPQYSKIFKCDDQKDTYILISDYLVRGESYIITKTAKGWLIKIVNQWIT
ncbi:hypothetical protein [Chryseobacterium sp. SORGH_AS_0447]|uniref:hypothetical protein n=1 Tax=Chryseobacterium sp. SORGH_AS_0447 TaxID=3041769 RepID=UPI0027D81652|nr:hypothetical protein [Chryseobacterium sp. SORGH_AS_0447]